MAKIKLANSEVIEVEKDMMLKDIAERHLPENNAVIAKVNNIIAELGDVITKDADVNFYTVADRIGNKIYVKGLTFVFSVALAEIYGQDIDYRIQTSVNHGLYVWFKNKMDEEFIEKLNQKMQEIINQDEIFKKVTVNRIDAIDYFEKLNNYEKVRLLRYNTNSYITLYQLRGHYDYFYGRMPYSTKSLNLFDLKIIEENGLLLRFPTVFNQGKIPEFIDQKNLFKAYQDFSKWCRGQKITYASDLNEYVTFKDINTLIRIEEGRHNYDLFNICKKIVNGSNKIKIVLIAGPTSSGKTTTSKKLSTYLMGMGLEVKSLSLDDYFKERVETPKDEAGEYDYESLAAIDVDLFNNHLQSLFEGKEVCLPSFNFLTGVKEYDGKQIKLKENTVLIIEGLHALNDELTRNIPADEKYKLYISPLSQLNLDRNNPISSSDIRLLRRIVRDRRYRGNSVADTINVWPKVRSAEDKYIYKYQAEANYVLNTSLLYEIGVLKTLAEGYLYEVNEENEEYEQVKMLLNFLRNFLPIPTEEIPKDSLLREFIGGSSYE